MHKYTISPSLLDPFEEKYEAQDVALAADVTDKGDSTKVVDLFHLQSVWMRWSHRLLHFCNLCFLLYIFAYCFHQGGLLGFHILSGRPHRVWKTDLHARNAHVREEQCEETGVRLQLKPPVSQVMNGGHCSLQASERWASPHFLTAL